MENTVCMAHLSRLQDVIGAPGVGVGLAGGGARGCLLLQRLGSFLLRVQLDELALLSIPRPAGVARFLVGTQAGMAGGLCSKGLWRCSRFKVIIMKA